MNPTVHSHLTTLSQKRTLLEPRRPINPAFVNNLEAWFDVELTYTSNILRPLATVENGGMRAKGNDVKL